MARGYVPLLLLLGAIWGASFTFIEWALDGFEPTTVMAARVTIAALVLLPVLVVAHGARGAAAELRSAGPRGFALGVLNSAIPFTLIAWGQTRVDSGTAAIANASVPIWIAILALRLRASERSTGMRLAGIVLGLAGVAVLTGEGPGTDSGEIVGTLAVVLASVAYALGILAAQGRMMQTQPLALVSATMIGAAVVLLPAGVAQAPAHMPGAKPIAAVVALAVLGTVVGVLLFFFMIRRYGSARASLVTYVMPAITLVYGAAFLGEPVTAAKVAGLGLILCGVALGSGLARPGRRRVPVTTPS